MIGYTNAGKSTVLNSLTGASVLEADALFATLDPTTRRAKLDGLKLSPEILLTDTVGFVQNLPTQLVAAFRATLEEVTEADVLVHVVDSALSWELMSSQITAVENVLSQIGAEGKPTIVLTHHHQLTSIASDENDGPNPDLNTVMGRHANTRMHIAGHLHRWYELQPTETMPVRHLILGSTRYDDDNFWVADFEGDQMTIVDEAKTRWFTTCADSWSYDGTPMSTDAIEEGDCGI